MKNPHAVALGRIGGSKTSDRKTQAAKQNILKRWRKAARARWEKEKRKG